MTCEIAWHFGIQEFEVPSLNTAALLWVRRTIFQLWIIEAPAAIAHDLPLLARLKVGVLWLLALIVPECVLELAGLEAVEGLGELVVDTYLRIAQGVH